MVYARSGTICSYPAFTVNDFNLDKSSQKHLTLILVGVSLVLSTVLLRIFSLQAVFIMALSMVSCEEHVYILLATTRRLGFCSRLMILPYPGVYQELVRYSSVYPGSPVGVWRPFISSELRPDLPYTVPYVASHMAASKVYCVDVYS